MHILKMTRWDKHWCSICCSILGALHTSQSIQSDILPFNHGATGALSGELRKWHKVTIGFDGPLSSETSSPRNPFTVYALDVNFTHASSSSGVKSYQVPGYYAADGNAANTGASHGNVWLVHFTPDEIGSWVWKASFKAGINVAQNGDGVSGGFFDGAAGSFDILPTNKSWRDHRGKGRLQYVGEHHLQFAETGDTWFMKGGADSPENFLAYDEFDNTPDHGGRRKSWNPHQVDYNEGDPTWDNGKGKSIIGAVNYLSEKGMNAFSFLTMNIEGDDENVFPYISESAGDDRLRIDVSKTAQWEVVFEHADHMGMYLHFKTQETENDQLLDNGSLGLERKLYYRELIARFGHHLALNWNLGEENTNTDSERKEFSDYFKQLDPYNHPVVVHTYPDEKELVYGSLVGYPNMDGASLQSHKSNVFADTKEWITRSAAGAHKWVVANDEQNPYQEGVKPDANDPTHEVDRQDVLWGNLMSGGAGVEYYFGYNFDNSDLTCQDFRSRDIMWDQTRYALQFFQENNIPFWEMYNDNSLVTNGAWCLAKPGEVYVVYVKDASIGVRFVDLPGGTGGDTTTTYTVKWFDPINGGPLQQGSVLTLNGDSGMQFLGRAPDNEVFQDWAILVTVDAVYAS